MTIEMHEYNLSSNENKLLDSTELTNTDVNIADETKTWDKVNDICYAKNMTNKTIEEEDQYVALVGNANDFVLSLRKRSDLNIELLTIKISIDELCGIKFCHHFVNTDGKDVIFFTFARNDDHSMRCLIKKEESWSEIEGDSSKTLDEQAQWFQTQSKTT